MKKKKPKPTVEAAHRARRQPLMPPLGPPPVKPRPPRDTFTVMALALVRAWRKQDEEAQRGS